MDKGRLRDLMVAKLLEELDVLTRAAHMARDEATSEESRAENKYDTRGQEAAYLAEGQARLALELQQVVAAFQSMPVQPVPVDVPTGIGAVLTLQPISRGPKATFLIGPGRGGLEVEIDGTCVTVVTPHSPLGRQVVGRKAGDVVQLPGRGGSIPHVIAAVA